MQDYYHQLFKRGGMHTLSLGLREKRQHIIVSISHKDWILRKEGTDGFLCMMPLIG